MKTGKRKMTGNTNKDQEFLNLIDEDEELFKKKFPKREGLKVPDGYFDSLSQRVQDRVAASDKKSPAKWFSLGQQSVKTLLIPVTITAVVLIAFIILLPNKKIEQQAIKTDTTPSASTFDYDASYAQEAIAIEDFDLRNEVANSKKDLGLVMSRVAENDTTISDSDIIEYLSEQEIDLELLAEL
jgi:hypothetical protein